MDKRFCKNCIHYKRGREFSVSLDFIEGYKYMKKESGRKIKVPNCELHSDFAPIEMCQHPTCFKVEEHCDKVNGYYTTKERIKGQAQLNADYSCVHFEGTIFSKFLNFVCKR